MFQKQSQTRGNMTGFVNEMLGNIKVVKVFDHGEKAQEEFDPVSYTHLDVYKRQV